MYNNKKVIHIVATGYNGEIGFNNQLLWHIPEDLRFFKETTLGNVVLMGRKTVESLPRALERRITIDITSNGGRTPLNLYLDHATWQSCETLNTDCIYIAGGASIYEATEDIVDEILLTKVCKNFNYADTFYNLPKDFKLIERSEYKVHKDLVYYFSKWVK